MPTYVYQCPQCENRFERFQRITDDPAAICDVCGNAACGRVITGGTFHLKGGGWHQSDYAPVASPAKPEPAPPTPPCGGDVATCGSCEALDAN